jgi:hypothetical protein
VSHRPHGTLARSLFDVEVGADAAGRNFVYSDPITNNLRTYSVAPAAMASASGEVFPFADGRAGLLRDVGVMAGYAQSLGLQSTAEGAKIPTNWNSYYAGARVRIHPGGDNGPIIGISDSYSALAFTFGSAGASIADQIPSVNYQANRAAVDARIPIGGMAILASAGFRVVFDAGDVASRFRQPSVNGVDGELGVAVGIVSGWEARLVGDYQRYFYSFTPVPGNDYVAGGALDQFFGGRLAVAYIF